MRLLKKLKKTFKGVSYRYESLNVNDIIENGQEATECVSQNEAHFKKRCKKLFYTICISWIFIILLLLLFNN